ncbi:TPA: 30S ribosomal protein S18 [Candidatus Poribacteria bacterium]|jgi:small subunit ribosomal protein S18|nr:30S ribosomal protein S18 [Candidatus Poribacteria bacterium]MCS5609196.1 30S ribosomal protein S18 [Candidatus Poribacteria bacterium]HCK15063.1 30S ribosomal protein S18 [Candidatus Poribacteria bacterium]
MRFRRRRRVTLKTRIDYKDVDLLRGFMDDRGKILPRRLTRLNTKQQRQVTKAIKRARSIALLPFTR